MLEPDGQPAEVEMGHEKSKGGRETRKPKADKNKKAKGQTPAPRTATVDAINHAAHNAK
jgi:hypothetical protein